MHSWDPDDVENIAPFTPSCYQSTWKIDDVDRITPFIPIRQCTWSVDDVDHIESFVPTANSLSPSSSQYDTASSLSPQSQRLDASPAAGFRISPVYDNTSTQPLTVDYSSESAKQSSSSGPVFECTEYASSECSSSPVGNSSSISKNTEFILNTSGEYVNPKCSSSPFGGSGNVSDSTEFILNTSGEYVNPKCSSSPFGGSGNVSDSTEFILNTSGEYVNPKCSSSPFGGSGNVSDRPEFILNTSGEYVNPKGSSSPVGKSSNLSENTEFILNTSGEYVNPKGSSSPVGKSSSVPESTEFIVNTSDEYVNRECSSNPCYVSVSNNGNCSQKFEEAASGSLADDAAGSKEDSCDSPSLGATHCDLDSLSGILDRVYASRSFTSDDFSDFNNLNGKCSSASDSPDLFDDCVEKEDNFDFVSVLRAIDSGSDNVDDENTGGSLEMSTEVVIQEPADDAPLPVQQGEMDSYSSTADTYNPYRLSRTCIAAPSCIGRGKDLSCEVELKEDYWKRRARMNGDFIPGMGRGAILNMYSDRHRTDKCLEEQLRSTLGVGYSNEVTEQFWRGEQEASEPAQTEALPPAEVDDVLPAVESASFLSPDIILVSPGNTIGPKKPPAELPKKPSVPFEKHGITFVSPGNTIRPIVTQNKKVEESPSEQSSPKKKKKPASVRKNRNALLNSLASQKEAEQRITPGMPPGALTYVHLDTPNKYEDRKEFHYEKEDFPPLC